MSAASRVRRALAIAAFFCSCAAGAAAPMQGTQAPGHYRWMLGGFEVTALSDGTFDLDTTTALTNTGDVPIDELLHAAFEGPAIPVSVNAFLINTGSRLVLIDTGAARRFGPTLGHLVDNLARSGYTPDQVDVVLLTHLHPDHVGGLVDDGRRTFANATVHVARGESAFWTSAAAKAAAGADRIAFFDGASESLDPYLRDGALRLFDAPVRIVDGIGAMPAPGHTRDT